jgi:GH15 family glucan-1,4-alpha-glucosidase
MSLADVPAQTWLDWLSRSAGSKPMSPNPEASLELAVIGNCQVSALVDEPARMVWACMPRFDSNPVFCALLMETSSRSNAASSKWTAGGFFRAEQRYVTNTPILETWLYDTHGGCIKIIDFAPRFDQFERIFRPVSFVRTCARGR